MKRRIRRAAIKAKYNIRRMHHKLGRMAEYSHLAYFGVLFMESKYIYAKVGVACMLFSILYMITDKEDD